MTYYLSKQNKSLILPFLKLLKHPEKGEVTLQVNSPAQAIQLLRNAANTDHKELRVWMFKNKHTHVLCIPKAVQLLDVPTEQYTELLDYIGLISYVTEHKPSDLLFTSAPLDDRDFGRLLAYGLRTGYTIRKIEGSGIHISKTTDGIQNGSISERNKDTEEGGSTPGGL